MRHLAAGICFFIVLCFILFFTLGAITHYTTDHLQEAEKEKIVMPKIKTKSASKARAVAKSKSKKTMDTVAVASSKFISSIDFPGRVTLRLCCDLSHFLSGNGSHLSAAV